MVVSNDVFVVEYSVSQDAFHVQTVKEMLSTNRGQNVVHRDGRRPIEIIGGYAGPGRLHFEDRPKKKEPPCTP